MDNKNKGYSLIELIVVIAIIGIVGVGSIIGLSMINGKPADQCASALKIALASHRLSTMGKDESDTYLEVFLDSEGAVWIRESLNGVRTESKACGRGVTIEVFYNDGSESTTLVANDPARDRLRISFNRHNGSFNLGSNISRLRISKATHAFNLTFYNLTGKVLLERE